MASFYTVNKEVLPLKAKLAIQEDRLQKANEELAVVQALDEKESELNVGKEQYKAAMNKKQQLIGQFNH